MAFPSRTTPLSTILDQEPAPLDVQEYNRWMLYLQNQMATAAAAALPAGTNTIGGTKDAGPLWTTVRGISGARFTSADQSAAVASITDAPTTGQKLVITDLLISSDTALRLDFNVESSATVIETVYMAAGETKQITLRSTWKLPTADKKLQVQASAAGNISLTPYYYSEA